MRLNPNSNSFYLGILIGILFCTLIYGGITLFYSDKALAEVYTCTYSVYNVSSRNLEGVFCSVNKNYSGDPCYFDLETMYQGKVYVDKNEVIETNEANSKYPNGKPAPWKLSLLE